MSLGFNFFVEKCSFLTFKEYVHAKFSNKTAGCAKRRQINGESCWKSMPQDVPLEKINFCEQHILNEFAWHISGERSLGCYIEQESQINTQNTFRNVSSYCVETYPYIVA